MEVRPTAAVCTSADIRGAVTIGTGAIVQPNAQILAEGGPISIGENTIIEEFAVIINRRPERLTIGENSCLHVGCLVDTSNVGSNAVVGCKAVVKDSRVPNGCAVAAKCALGPSDQLSENWSVFGRETNVNITHAAALEQRLTYHQHQADVLRSTIPKYHAVHPPSA